MVSDASGDVPQSVKVYGSRAPNPPAGSGRGASRKVQDKPLVWTLPGFGPMSRVTTSFGDVHAQALRLRDLVRTKSGEFKPIVWLDRLVLEEEFLHRHPDALPVLIRAHALGRGLPRADLALSPRQPVSPVANRLPTSARTAADLLQRPGVFRKAETTVTYTLFHCGEPQLVMAERLWVSVSP